jgi:hypothetical protein
MLPYARSSARFRTPVLLFAITIGVARCGARLDCVVAHGWIACDARLDCVVAHGWEILAVANTQVHSGGAKGVKNRVWVGAVYRDGRSSFFAFAKIVNLPNPPLPLFSARVLFEVAVRSVPAEPCGGSATIAIEATPTYDTGVFGSSWSWRSAHAPTRLAWSLSGPTEMATRVCARVAFCREHHRRWGRHLAAFLRR